MEPKQPGPTVIATTHSALSFMKGFTNWDEGQPQWENYINFEECIFLGHKSLFNLKWHDHRCSYNTASYICEYNLEAESEPELEPEPEPEPEEKVRSGDKSSLHCVSEQFESRTSNLMSLRASKASCAEQANK